MRVSFLGLMGAVAMATGTFSGSALLAQQKTATSSTTPDYSTELPDFENLSPRQAFSIFRETENRWLTEPCTFGVPLTAVLERDQSDAIAIVRLSLFAQAVCADEEQRYQDGLDLMRQSNALNPDEPEVGLTLYFIERLEDADAAIELITSLEGEALGVLDADSFWRGMRAIRSAGRGEEAEALALQMFDDNKIAFLDGDIHAGLAYNALAAAAREGRTDVAENLLRYITSPRTYIDLLTSRRYEFFWPQIEERAGPNLSLIGAENVEISSRRLTNAPMDRDRFSDAAHALHFNGDFQAAIDLAQTWREREERGLELEEGDAWALNIQAYAYDSLGQPERADAVFEELAAVDPENGWSVSFIINRSSRLVGQGRWEEGFAASQYARTVRGSTYAEMIVARDHSCALNRLGREEEALAELDFLRENKEVEAGMVATALLCNGLRDEAAAILIEALRDPATRDSTISGLLTAETDLFYTQNMLPSRRNLMAEYPELAEEFAKHARDLPEAFIPRAALLRERLDLPEWD